MWVDDQGVCHTVALPNPTVLMSDVFRHSLDRLLARGPEDVAELIETEETRFYEEHAGSHSGDSDEPGFVGATPPQGLMTRPIATSADLISLIREIEDRWRLDALVALDDYLP